MTRTIVGIDLGGTNLRVCLVDDGGRRLAEYFGEVPRGITAEELLKHIFYQVGLIEDDMRPIGLGLGVAGALDEQDRLIGGMTNLPVLAGMRLAKILGDGLNLPVRIDNDARTAMLGEALFGGARHVGNALMLTLGTGIGGALLLDGKVRRGPHRLAGEIGLSPVADELKSGGTVALEDAASPGDLHARAASIWRRHFVPLMPGMSRLLA